MKQIIRYIYSFLLAKVVYSIKFKRKIRLSGISYIKRDALTAGFDCFINRGCYIGCNTELGDFVMIAGGVAIVGGDHKMNRVDTPMIYAGKELVNCQVTIESDVWIGHGAILIGPIRIGQGSVVAAGSVVTKDVPSYTVVAGVPAEKIKNRFANFEQREKHKKCLHEYYRQVR